MLQGNKDLETHPLFAFLGFTVITHRFLQHKGGVRFQRDGMAIPVQRQRNLFETPMANQSRTIHIFQKNPSKSCLISKRIKIYDHEPQFTSLVVVVVMQRPR